jgi:subtilase family serine protease
MRASKLSPIPASLPLALLLCAIFAGTLSAASGQVSDATPPVLPSASHQIPTEHPQAEQDRGPIPPETPLLGVALHFRRTPAQEADLQSLLAGQQNVHSQLYHQWLTPEQFAARFGLPESELKQVENWLRRQGFAIDSVARGRTMLRFSGTAAQVNAAFATDLHTYVLRSSYGVETHYAPATAPRIPPELSSFVESVSNLDNFRPKSHLHLSAKTRPRPEFSGYDQTIFFAPVDIALEYDIQPAYAVGFDGTGQSIAIVGQSQITLSDIESFQSAAGLPVKDPNLILIPNTGAPVHVPGDETESDLDLEWSGAIGRGATLTLVYTGSSDNLGAFDAIEYAIDNRLANLVSISYGACETALAGFSLETFFDQAAAQGQTVIAASGDSGSTDCFGDSRLSVEQQQVLAVDYPASSPNVTGVGGTEISQANPAYETQGGGYWEKSNGSSDVLASLTQAVPEQAWNEDKTCASLANQGGDPICSAGGGASALFARPKWQSGVPGIPPGSTSGDQRDVPDVALAASIFNPGYLFCTSDQSAWQQNQVSSCSAGFRDAITGSLTAAGGTSFAAPIFAGMMAIVNQKQGYVTGSGLANPNLYELASNSATYASAFHDITTGDNACDSGPPYCQGMPGFAANPGYDQATGLGTVDLAHLATAWPISTAPAILATITTVTVSSKTPALNASDICTIAVKSVTGTTIPTGTVTVAVDASAPIPGNALNASGGFTYATSFATEGTHEVLVSYSGDAAHAPSTGSAAIQVPTATSGTQSFSLNATNGTVNPGSSGTSTITVTPANGYIGTVNLSFSIGNNVALQNLCFEFTDGTSGTGNVTIAGARSVKTQLKFIDMASDCITSQSQAGRLARPAQIPRNPRQPSNAAALASLLFVGFLARKARRLRALAAMLLVVCTGLVVATLIEGCGGNRGSNVISPPSGNFTVTITGKDLNSTAIPAATTTFELTID